SQRKGALLLVTHDRYFLNRIVNRIIEIDKAKLYSYDGNFEYFLEKKTQREELLAATEEKRRRLYMSELAWIRRGAKARTTKQKARIQRFEEIKKSEIAISKEQIEIPVAYTRLGKKAIEINNISKSFNGQSIIKNFSTIISPDDRIGIVGPNGAGKTTFLNLIAGILSPDNGNISLGETVKIAYYRQENTELNPDIRAIDYIRETAEYVETEDGRTMSAARMLEQFLFDDVQRYSLIKNLSGGEKRRLLLAKVLMEKPNVLLLDEPTNDLDIQTLEVLEEYLSYFRGVVLISSHDRYFLEKTTDRLIAVKGNGKVEFFTSVETYNKSILNGKQKAVSQKKTKQFSKSGTGNLSPTENSDKTGRSVKSGESSNYGQPAQSGKPGQPIWSAQPEPSGQLEPSGQSAQPIWSGQLEPSGQSAQPVHPGQSPQPGQPAKPIKPGQPEISGKASQKVAGRKEDLFKTKPKFTYKETREFDTIDKEIEQIEKDLEKITEEMQDSWADHVRIKKLNEKHEKLQKELSVKMERWTYLNEKAEQIKLFNNR
ncbi:MAG: ATP-binding cassette domain-containing protein, partial [Actinomycetota bacterium]|nr:ATP-binding cassette domain-containing protein [Actinomycetota bacterium]